MIPDGVAEPRFTHTHSVGWVAAQVGLEFRDLVQKASRIVVLQAEGPGVAVDIAGEQEEPDQQNRTERGLQAVGLASRGRPLS